MSYDINKIFSDMEQDLIKSYKKALSRGVTEDTDWETWQAQKLKDLREYRKETRRIVNKHTRRAHNAATGEIESSYNTGQSRAEEVLKKFKKTHSPQDFSKINRRKMDALIDAVNNDFNKASYAALRMVDDEYRQTMYRSQAYYSSGTSTLAQSVDLASKDFLQKGINAIEYSNGRKVNIASYAEMAIRTSAKKAYLTGEGSKMAEWGEYLVQVTSYGGCSDTCLPWQGKVYFDDVFTGGSPDKNNKYPLLSEAISEGLYHPNCRHSQHPYFEGISSEPEELDVRVIKENYAAEQRQRAIERKIREWKRVEEGSIDPENRERASEKVKAWQSQMRKHIQDNPNLRRKSWREQLADEP